MKNLKILLVLIIMFMPLSGLCATTTHYDKYGHKTGSYRTSGNTTTHYDNRGHKTSSYKTNSSGRTIEYDKYGRKTGSYKSKH